MSLTRTELFGKKVYNPDGSWLGDVQDIGFALGGSGFSIVVNTSSGMQAEVPWEKVAAAKDILILKENFDESKAVLRQPVQSSTAASPAPVFTQPVVQQGTTTQTTGAASAEQKGGRFSGISGALGRKKDTQEKTFCPTCGKDATWIPEYQRMYCYNCKKYL